MGCGGSKSVEDQQSKQVEKTLASAQREDAKTVKLLLLGAGESGKTTFLKQLKARFSAPPTARELSEVADIIRGNILEFMANLATAMVDLELDGDLQDELQPTVSKLTSMNTKDTAELTPVFARNLLALWLSAPAQAVFARRAEFQLVESHTVFIERAVEIADPRFEADFQDMLKARVKTSGIKSENLVIDGVNFEIFDVGGQKSERRKWIRCFDNVTAIVFFVGISEYDQMMHEDETTNRMEDAIGLFHETVTNEAFEKTSVCVFLNKVDLFENKLKTVPISSVQKEPCSGELQVSPVHPCPSLGWAGAALEWGLSGLCREGEPIDSSTIGTRSWNRLLHDQVPRSSRWPFERPLQAQHGY
uniref:Uncharacterized protein n=1 Tax=Rhizochromulina marina TaxID=1034831 RepID=A0A7S2RHV6_9STRA